MKLKNIFRMKMAVYVCMTIASHYHTGMACTHKIDIHLEIEKLYT